MQAVSVELREVGKTFPGQVTVLRRVSLRIEPGELVTLLGPSGSGKTTLLRVVAGFEELTDGEIFVDGAAMSRVPTHRRRLGMVAQDYALFPHMSVRDNLAFGMRSAARHWPGEDRPSRSSVNHEIHQMLELVGLGDLHRRRPHQLSGGQKQRVALARALVTRPRILLLDEPFAALDRKLREQLQVDLRMLQRQVGITTIFVTHDQGEALSMSDRVAVLNGGTLEQFDTPMRVYDWPATRFVADFIGRTNFLTGRLRSRTGKRGRLCLADGSEIEVPVGVEASPGDDVEFSLRPERIRLVGPDEPENAEVNRLSGRVRHVVYLGDTIQVKLESPVGELSVTVPTTRAGQPAATVGDQVQVEFAADAATPLRVP